MPVTLPTITLPDVQGARILAAYKARFGTTTQAETALAFKRWLAAEVKAVVLAHEGSVIDERNNASKRAELAAADAALPDPDTIV